MPTTKAKPLATPQQAPKNMKDSSATAEASGQDKWDELLQTPESEAFLTVLVAEARAERENGKLLEGDWE
jgi:hypothetical protein